jgi:hypothetical protein
MAKSKTTDETDTARPVGHPVSRWTPMAKEDMLGKLQEYVDNTDVPILAEFAYQNHIRRQTLYELGELADARGELIAKKEAQLERLALEGKINHSMAVFSLKQLGWKDTQSIEHSGSIDFYANLTPEERMARIKELGGKLAANG